MLGLTGPDAVVLAAGIEFFYAGWAVSLNEGPSLPSKACSLSFPVTVWVLLGSPMVAVLSGHNVCCLCLLVALLVVRLLSVACAFTYFLQQVALLL